MDMLESPVIKTSQKIDLFEKVYSKIFTKLSLDFIIMVLKNRRETHIPGMIRYFTHLYMNDQGIKKAELIVPAEVSDAYKKKFQDLLKKVYDSRIEFSEVINPDIIGGFILKVEDQQFDASVSSSLAKIRKQLLEKTIS